MSYETLAIYRRKQDGRYIVQPMARHPTGASVEFGDPTIIPEEDLATHIVQVVLENLALYNRVKYDHSTAPRSSDEDFAAFLGNHDALSVTREDTGVISVVPHVRKRGGTIGRMEAAIRLSPGQADTQLATAIRTAFESIRAGS